jgi:hypothetical protein
MNRKREKQNKGNQANKQELDRGIQGNKKTNNNILI